MKNIAILTRRYGENFGSSFQAFALQYTIDRLGFKSKVLDYDELHHSFRWRVKPFLYDTLYFFCKIGILKLFYRKLYFMLLNRHKQKYKFRLFDNVTLHKTSKKLKSKKQLSQVVSKFDYCVCGSDQIWSPFLFDENYYLTFVNKNLTKKVAYAASLGIYDETLIFDQMKGLISDFDYISVRESNAVDLLANAGVKNKIEFVLDPTLLVDKSIWKSFQSDYHIEGNYILCYFLGKNIPNNFIQALKAKTNMKVLNIQMYYNINNLNADIELFDVGPSDFLSLLSTASYVCTDSYHGVLMSYNFQKNFFVFNRFKESDFNNQNSRVDSVLTLMMLESRRVNDNSDVNDMDLCIHYPVDNTMSDMVEKSISYIKNSLQN